MEEVPVRFLGVNSLTEIQNGRDARINGIETDFSYVHGGLTLNAAAAYTDAKTKGNICTLVRRPRSELPRCCGRRSGLSICAERHATCRSHRSSRSLRRRVTAGRHGETAKRTSRADKLPWICALVAANGHCTRPTQAKSSIPTTFRAGCTRNVGRPVRRTRLAEMERRAVRHQHLRQARSTSAGRQPAEAALGTCRSRSAADDRIRAG